MWLWLKQKSPDLVPIMTLVHDPVKGVYPAIRWVRPDEPLPERPEQAAQPWMHLGDALHRYAYRLYDKNDHRLHGSYDIMTTLIKIAEALPEGHPLREKATKLALLHACLLESKRRLPSDVFAWFEKNIKKFGSKLPPASKTEPTPKPQPTPKLNLKRKRKPRLRVKAKIKPAERFSKFNLEPIVTPPYRLSHESARVLMREQRKLLLGKWHRWARKRYGTTDSPDIKDGIVTNLTGKLIADREFVEAFIESPLNFRYATIDDALKDEGGLRESVYAFVDGLVGAWAQTASDHHPLVWALQIAIAQEFGLKDRYKAAIERLKEISKSDEEPYLLEQATFLYDTFKPILHKYVRAVYSETQEFLKEFFEDTGLDGLYLARGVGLTGAQAADLPLEDYKVAEPPFLPASSWSFDYATAEWFAWWVARKYDLNPAIYMIKLPKDAFHLIISTALTGWGCFNEKEIVLAMPEGQEVWATRLRKL
jgi:hypothetical protein